MDWRQRVRWWPAPGIRRRLTRGVVVLVTAAALSAVAVFGETGKFLAAAGVFQGPGEVVRRWRDISARLHDMNPRSGPELSVGNAAPVHRVRQGVHRP